MPSTPDSLIDFRTGGNRGDGSVSREHPSGSVASSSAEPAKAKGKNKGKSEAEASHGYHLDEDGEAV